MKFLNIQENEQKELYFKYLKAICSLSRLFSDSEVPYLYYRVSENIFCKCFNAENLAREDLAFDARKNYFGIGIKTFVYKTSNFEKISEFNAMASDIRHLINSPEQLMLKIAELRNERIDFATQTYGINNSIYHCIVRKEGRLQIFETNLEKIDIASLEIKNITKASLSFHDKKEEYLFNFSKSTLFKKFIIPPSNTVELEIEILNDPLTQIVRFLESYDAQKDKDLLKNNYVILPLYSTRLSNNNQKVVPEKSGLNQWNASGRPRDLGEVYIPIPIWIHKHFPNFFPKRDTSFKLLLPDGKILKAKVCQENSKALMTNPNHALADWLLRKVLQLKEGELLTYEKLKKVGVDSVRIIKINEENFKIEFAKLDSYEKFRSKFI